MIVHGIANICSAWFLDIVILTYFSLVILELDILIASAFITLSDVLRDVYKNIKQSAKEIEWLPEQVKFTVSAQLKSKEEREETILNIFKSSRKQTNFSEDTISITDIFAVGSIGQNITGTTSTEGSKRIVIEGTPGIGKTALAKEIAYSWATYKILIEIKIVFLLYLRDPQLQSITTTKQLVEYMSMGCLDNEQIENFSKYLVNTKGQELCIVMDGFNEYPTLLKEKSFIIDIINKTVLSNAIVVITSRPTVAVSLYNQVDIQLHMIGFSTKDVSQKIYNVGKCGRHLIARSCFPPLYLALLLYLSRHQLDHHLSSSHGMSHHQLDHYLSSLHDMSHHQLDHAEIIGLFILHTVHCHTARYTPSCPVDQLQDTSEFITDILYNLSELAFRGLQEHKLVFTFDEIKQICPYIDEAFIGLGLLQSVEHYPYKGAGTTASFSFLHYTMQEFLAALHVSILPSEQQLTLIENTFWEDYYLFMWEIFADIPQIIRGTPHVYRQYIRKKNIDTVIFTVMTKICDCIMYYNTSIFFMEMNIFPHHVSLLMFLISSLSIQWKELEITHCGVTDIGMSTLEGYISEKLSTLEYVDLSHNNSSPWGVYCAIIRHSNVTNLALCGIIAYEMRQYVDGITKSLQMNNNLQSLTLCNILGNVKPILRCIATSIEFNLPCRKMSSAYSVDNTKSVLLHTALNYKSNDTVPVSDNGRIVKVNLMCHGSCDSLTENLNTLDASKQDIDDYGVTVVITFCDKYDIINLSNNHITHVGAATIGEYLNNNICLLELNLSENNIGPNGTIAIAKAIEVNASLQKFDISRCRVTDDGAAAISDCLKCNHSLQELNLSQNNISDVGAATISDSLKYNHSLQELNLSQNNISSDGTKKIAKAFQRNVTLQKLDLSHNRISDVGAAAISDSLKCNHSLQELNLSQNNISDVGAAAISDSLKTNSTLQVLDMSNNRIISSGAEKIAEAIQVNPTLHTLYLHKSPITEAECALSFNLAVLNKVHLNNTLRKLTLIRVYGDHDETLVNNEVEKIIEQRTRQGSGKLEILMKI